MGRTTIPLYADGALSGWSRPFIHLPSVGTTSLARSTPASRSDPLQRPELIHYTASRRCAGSCRRAHRRRRRADPRRHALGRRASGGLPTSPGAAVLRSATTRRGGGLLARLQRTRSAPRAGRRRRRAASGAGVLGELPLPPAIGGSVPVLLDEAAEVGAIGDRAADEADGDAPRLGSSSSSRSASPSLANGLQQLAALHLHGLARTIAYGVRI